MEFGCGYGTFTIPAAQLVGGRVFALDIEREMVAVTARKAAEAGLHNVVVNDRDFVETGCGRPDASVDYALLFNILHLEDPVRLLREARRALVPGGKAGIIHWRSDLETPRGISTCSSYLNAKPRFQGESFVQRDIHGIIQAEAGVQAMAHNINVARGEAVEGGTSCSPRRGSTPRSQPA
ncbi:hypothetical protein BH10PLA2_BH10PLA2_30390 [soil metagenome]